MERYLLLRRWTLAARRCVVLLALILCLGNAAQGQTTAEMLGLVKRDLYSTNDFGGVGLLQTRTARFAQDGQFTVGGSFLNPYRRYYLNWQILPWAEVTFRYTDITNVDAFLFTSVDQSDGRFFRNLFSFKQGGTFLDRGFDLKLRLREESEYFPAVAVGLQDFLGTGLFASEYLVFSKRHGELDFHMGMAWGYLGNRNTIGNPLRHFSDGFRRRDSGFGQGGNLGFKRWFSGKDVGIFGGIEYHTPVEGLSLKVEYSSASTEKDPLSNKLKETLPVNFGINYRIEEWADLSLGWERGNTLLFHLALRYNLNNEGNPKPDVGPSTAIRADIPEAKSGEWVTETVTPPPMTNLERQLAHFGLELGRITIAGDVAKVSIVGTEFSERADFDARVAYAIFDTLPDDIRTARLSLPDSEQTVTLKRNDWLPQQVALSPEQLTRRILGGFSFWVQDVKHEDKTLEVEVDAPDWARERDYRIATNLVFERAGKEVETITLVASSRVGGIHRFIAYNPFLPLRAEPEFDKLEWQVVDGAAQNLFKKLPQYGFRGYALSINGREATIYAEGIPTRSPGRNLGRAARLATQALPPSIDAITVVFMARRMEFARVTVMRRDIENAAQDAGSAEEIYGHAIIEEPLPNLDIPPGSVTNDKPRGRLSWGFGPDLRQHIGNPEEGLYKVDVNLEASFVYRLTPKVRVSATVSRYLFGNIAGINRTSNSILPHVRSDLVEFTKEGRTAITQLKIDYITRLSRTLLFRASGGILEWMYAGAGAEILFHQNGSRWAFGADLNWVKKRGFKQLFGFQGYDVVTGHISIYHSFPFYDMGGSIHIGRYLAKDKGATFELTRRFKSGIEVGGFFTLTSASAIEFGEGSFDKGFFIRIPFDAMTQNRTTKMANFVFRPLTRDGGQRVENGPRLIAYSGFGYNRSLRDTWRDFMQ